MVIVNSMDKDSFYNLFLEFNSRFHMAYPQEYMSVRPFCICIESECFYNGQIDKFVSFFTEKQLSFDYSCFYVHTGVRLIFTFNFD